MGHDAELSLHGPRTSGRPRALGMGHDAELSLHVTQMRLVTIATSIREDPEPLGVLSESSAPLNLTAKFFRQFTKAGHAAILEDCRIEGASAAPACVAPRTLLVPSPSGGEKTYSLLGANGRSNNGIWHSEPPAAKKLVGRATGASSRSSLRMPGVHTQSTAQARELAGSP